MAKNQALRIAVLIDHIESDYPVEVLRGVLKGARSSRARVLVIPGGALSDPRGPPVVRNFVYDLLAQAKVDGLVILAGSLSNLAGVERFRAWVEGYVKIPAVFVGIDQGDRPSVYADNAAGIRAVVSHLVETHGKRRIAFLRGPEESLECEARRLAYLDTLGAHGIEPDPRLVVTGGLERERGGRAVADLFDRHRFTTATVDAIVAVNDDSALGAIEELGRRGIHVPDPMAVVGFDDAEGARASNPPLTTVAQGVEAQAHAAVRSLLEHLERGTPLGSRTIDPVLVVRSSCGCRQRFQNDSGSVRPPAGGMARTCRLALIERRTSVLAELSRAAAGRLTGMSGWESRLLDALLEDLSTESGGVFVAEVEQVVRQNVALGRDVMICHEVLTVLRLQAVACATLEPGVRPRVEDLFQESRLTIARIGAEVERDRVRTLQARLRLVTKGCLSLLGTLPRAELAPLLTEHLPALGIRGFSVTRFRGKAGDTELDLLVRRAEGISSPGDPTLPLGSLGLDEMLEGEEVMLIEPLEFDGHPVGLAALAWGARDPLHYEQLREVLGAAVYGLGHKPRQNP
jgi:DNA-binding LacI/PurR family transcriptional regulator